MRSLAPFIDRFGVITQSQNNGADGGDSLNRSCAFILSQKYQYETVEPWMHMLPAFYHPTWKGLLRRHPDESKWYGSWNRASRDQTIPYIILLGETKQYGLLAWYFFMHMLRGLLFTTNTRRNFQYPMLEEHLAKSTPDVKWDYSWKVPDLTALEFWALYIRALPKPLRILLYPVLTILDIETFIGALVKRFITPKDDDIIVHTLVLINAERRTPTLFSRWAAKVTGYEFIMDRLYLFFRKDIEPPLDQALEPAVRKYI